MAVPTKRRDQGASLVEFALLAPVLFMLLLGTVTGGLTLSRQNAVNNAVREASRFGAVLEDFDSSSLPDLYRQVVAAASGDLDAGVADRAVCVAVIEGSGPDANKWSYSLYTNSDTPEASGTKVALATVPAECTDGFDSAVGVDTARIWVRATRSSEIEAILFSAQPQFDAHSLSRYEQ